MRNVRLARRRRLAAEVAVSTVVAALALTPVTPAQALSGSTFDEADGNLVIDGNETDWKSFVGNISCGDVKVGCGTDLVKSSQDNGYGQGSKDDHPTLTLVNQQVPPSKTDLKRAYVATETVGLNVFMYFAWIRSNNNGTTNFSIELNENLPIIVGNQQTFDRTNARLITWDLGSGGNKVELAAYQWIPAGGSGSCEKASAPPCWGNRQDLDAQGFANGSVNQSPFTNANSVSDPIFNNETLDKGTFGEAAINMTAAGLLGPCAGLGSVTVRSRASSSFGAELKDTITSFETAVELPVDVSGANANGSALGYSLKFTDRGATVISVGPEPAVSSAQTGAGSDENSAFLNEIAVPPADIQVGSNLLGQSRTIKKGELFESGPLAQDSPIKLLQTLARSTVTAAPPEATQLSRATLLDVNVINGLVTADKVTAEVRTVAHPNGASIEDNGSGISNLQIAGAVKNGSNYNQTYLLPQFGPNSKVEVLMATSGSGASPPPGTPIGTPVTWEVQQDVKALHVLIEDTNQPAETANLLAEDGNQTLELTIASASGQSKFPTILCQAAQEVAGHAFILQAKIPGVAEVTHGFVSIPRTGGAAISKLDELEVKSGAVKVATLLAAKTFTQGDWDSDSADANSSAEGGTLCLLAGVLSPACAVEATLTKVASASTATAGVASATPTFHITAAKVAGEAVAVPVDQETKVDLKVGDFDVGDVVFNERVFDPASAGHAGVTVRAVRVTLDTADLGLPLGAEIVVLEAHSGATFLPAP